MVTVRQPRIRDEKRQDGREHENDAPGGVMLEETVERAAKAHRGNFPVFF